MKLPYFSSFYVLRDDPIPGRKRISLLAYLQVAGTCNGCGNEMNFSNQITRRRELSSMSIASEKGDSKKKKPKSRRRTTRERKGTRNMMKKKTRTMIILLNTTYSLLYTFIIMPPVVSRPWPLCVPFSFLLLTFSFLLWSISLQTIPRLPIPVGPFLPCCAVAVVC